VGLCGVLAVVGAVVGAGSAQAAGGRALARLMNAGCPSYEVISSGTYTQAEQQAALNGSFRIGSYTFHLVPPVNWRQDPAHSSAIRGAFQRLSWLDPLYFIYRSNPSSPEGREALRHARALVFDWVRASRGPHPGVDPIAWRNKVAGDRAPYIAYLARSAACQGMLGKHGARLLLDSLRRHVRFLETHRHDPSNHGLFVNFGLAALSDYLSFMGDSTRWRHEAERSFAKTVRRRLVGREGVWLEHTTQYQVVVADLVDRFYTLTGGESSAVAKILDRMRRAAARFVMPDGLMTQIGDSNLNPAPSWAAALVPGQRGLTPMLRSGYATVSEPHSYLAVGASFFNGSHKQSDELSFQLFEDGHRVVSDGGRYAIDRTPMRRFAVAARSHSVLTVGHRGFSRRPKHAYGSALDATGQGDGWYAIEGHNPLVRRRGVAHSRLFLYHPGDALVVVDRVRSHHRHRYTRYFQLGPDIGATRASGGVALSAPGLKGVLADAPVHGHQSRLGLVRGRHSPIQGFTFPAFRQAVPRWTAHFRNAASSRDYVATFGFGAAPSSAALGKGRGTTVVISRAGVPLSKVSAVRHGDQISVTAAPAP
jgi:hypothetical protein